MEKFELGKSSVLYGETLRISWIDYSKSSFTLSVWRDVSYGYDQKLEEKTVHTSGGKGFIDWVVPRRDTSNGNLPATSAEYYVCADSCRFRSSKFRITIEHFKLGKDTVKPGDVLHVSWLNDIRNTMTLSVWLDIANGRDKQIMEATVQVSNGAFVWSVPAKDMDGDTIQVSDKYYFCADGGLTECRYKSNYFKIEACHRLGFDECSNTCRSPYLIGSFSEHCFYPPKPAPSELVILNSATTCKDEIPAVIFSNVVYTMSNMLGNKHSRTTGSESALLRKKNCDGEWIIRNQFHVESDLNNNVYPADAMAVENEQLGKVIFAVSIV